MHEQHAVWRQIKAPGPIERTYHTSNEAHSALGLQPGSEPCCSQPLNHTLGGCLDSLWFHLCFCEWHASFQPLRPRAWHYRGTFSGCDSIDGEWQKMMSRRAQDRINVQLLQQQPITIDFKHKFLLQSQPGQIAGRGQLWKPGAGRHRDSHRSVLWLPEWSRGREVLPLDTS